MKKSTITAVSSKRNARTSIYRKASCTASTLSRCTATVELSRKPTTPRSITDCGNNFRTNGARKFITAFPPHLNVSKSVFSHNSLIVFSRLCLRESTSSLKVASLNKTLPFRCHSMNLSAIFILSSSVLGSSIRPAGLQSPIHSQKRPHSDLDS